MKKGNKRRRFLTAFVGLLILIPFVLVGCGGNQTTSSPTPTATPTPTPTPTSVVITSPIVGTYTVTITQQDVASMPDLAVAVGHWTLTLRNDGVHVFSNADDGDLVHGTYQVSPGQVSFTDLMVCAESYGSDAATGTYSWTLQGKTLILRAKVDSCPNRKLVLTTHPWVKQD